MRVALKKKVFNLQGGGEIGMWEAFATLCALDSKLLTLDQCACAWEYRAVSPSPSWKYDLKKKK